MKNGIMSKIKKIIYLIQYAKFIIVKKNENKSDFDCSKRNILFLLWFGFLFSFYKFYKKIELKNILL